MIETPRLTRIIQVDYLSQMAAIFILVIWAMQAGITVLQLEGFSDFIFLALAVSIASPLVLLWRYITIRAVFSEGTSVAGIISNVSFFRDRGRISYIYTYGGQKYECGNAVSKGRFTTALSQGQAVTVVVDENNPKRAFVRELYL
jgi:hypothetical protein